MPVLCAVSGRQEAGEQVPQWQLRCSRESELQQLCKELAALHESTQSVSLTPSPLPTTPNCLSVPVYVKCCSLVCNVRYSVQSSVSHAVLLKPFALMAGSAGAESSVATAEAYVEPACRLVCCNIRYLGGTSARYSQAGGYATQGQLKQMATGDFQTPFGHICTGFTCFLWGCGIVVCKCVKCSDLLCWYGTLANIRLTCMSLQDAAKPGMQHATNNNPSGLQHVAQLLSGHQTVAAAVLAVSMGDVRLASLLAQVSHFLQCNPLLAYATA